MSREKIVSRIEQNGMPKMAAILSPLLRNMSIEYYKLLSSFLSNSSEAQKTGLLIHSNIINPAYNDEIVVETKKLHALVLAKYGGKTQQSAEESKKPPSLTKDGIPVLNLILPIVDFNRYIKRKVKQEEKSP